MYQEKLGQYIIGKKILLSASIKELVCILTLIGKEHPQISIGLVKFIRSSLRFCKPKICNFTVVFQSACRLGELCINSKLTQMEKVYFDIVYRINFSNFMLWSRSKQAFTFSHTTVQLILIILIFEPLKTKHRLLTKERLFIKRDQPVLNCRFKLLPWNSVCNHGYYWSFLLVLSRWNTFTWDPQWTQTG